MPTETAIKDKIMKHLKGLPNCYALKVWGNHTTVGQPDILACYRGRFMALEVKRPGEQPTEIQKATLSKWAEAGAVAGVVRSVEDAKLAVKCTSVSLYAHPYHQWIDFTSILTEGFILDGDRLVALSPKMRAEFEARGLLEKLEVE